MNDTETEIPVGKYFKVTFIYHKGGAVWSLHSSHVYVNDSVL